MGFLKRLFGFGSKARIINISGPGTFQIEIAGESNYQKALNKIAGPKERDSKELIVTAHLIHEDDNPHDNKAIRVDINEMTVGYLPREDARKYRREFKAAGFAGYDAKCKAKIVGGWKDGRSEGSFGVKLDMPTN